ncbi:MAG: tRNA pseudouridine(38-40) synthase TruA [Armatimonadota bacterium]
MRCFKAVVEYDGTEYYGFQIQKNVPTIQGELERVISQIMGHSVEVVGSGRTDAGVHASGQVISFKANGTIPVENLCCAANALLPSSIVLLSACEADENFHARYSAKSRIYRYTILNRQMPSALLSRYTWHIKKHLDENAMNRATKYLIGKHDFKCFATKPEKDTSTEREVFESSVSRKEEFVIFEIKANAFLRAMVRSIVGTLVEVGLGEREEDDIVQIMESSDRSRAGKTAPPQGLNLLRVEY